MKIALAGGGTAGHTSPLIATAQALLRAGSAGQVEIGNEDIVCLGTPKGLETTVIPAAGLRLELIDPVPMPRKLGADLAKMPFRLAKAVRQARKILRANRSECLIGFGGYVSMPAYLAAKTLGIPVVIHEQNALPGIANRVGARFAKLVATTFPNTTLAKATFVGMPLRKELSDLAASGRADSQSQARRFFGLADHLPTLLVSGGSQGAKSLNDSTVGAMKTLLGAGIQILHVWGPKNFPEAAEIVTDETTSARYVPVRYVDKMETAYCAADLMLGRCGAGTVVETAVLGLPAIFVPYPYGNGEQGRNAASLVEAGAGLLIEDAEINADWLADKVTGLFSDRAKLESMAQAGRTMMPANSADRFAEMIIDGLRGNKWH